jgi:hypothetical protein
MKRESPTLVAGVVKLSNLEKWSISTDDFFNAKKAINPLSSIYRRESKKSFILLSFQADFILYYERSKRSLTNYFRENGH